jgi:hypothetical protein
MIKYLSILGFAGMMALAGCNVVTPVSVTAACTALRTGNITFAEFNKLFPGVIPANVVNDEKLLAQFIGAFCGFTPAQAKHLAHEVHMKLGHK